MGDLIDTTEMYLKTVLEMEEDGVTPLRARIVERLGHSGPTVSQTVARMERDGLMHVLGDRRLELTDEGRRQAIEVLRKHRLAERLLIDVIGVPWSQAHEEACRWEHVMSDAVEEKLQGLLKDPIADPYGNVIPGNGPQPAGRSVEVVIRGQLPAQAEILRIGEPLQAEAEIIAGFEEAGVRPGVKVRIDSRGFDAVSLSPVDADGVGNLDHSVVIPLTLTPHLFVGVE